MEANLLYNLKDFSYSDVLKLNKNLSGSVVGKDFTVDVLSNITVNPLKEILELFTRSLSRNPIIRFGNYDNIVQDTFVLGETDLAIVFYELINVTENFHLQAELMDNAQLEELIEKCKTDIDLILNNLAAKPMVLFNRFSALPFTGSNYARRNLERVARELNEHLTQHQTANVRLIDLERIISELGIENALDKKKFIKYKSLYKIDFLKYYVSAIENLLLRRTGKLKKALVFDCDNTLWKGVIGEDGPQGIDMSPSSDAGRYYHMVQRIAAELSRKGILICLCSKNNQAEVDDLLGKHPNMLLNNDHIVAKKINWKNKDENLAELAEELNIGLDSFVFVDDSDFEINLIRSRLPEVLTIQVPKDVSSYPEQILQIAQRFFNIEPLKEDLQKVRIYKEQALRMQAMSSSTNIDEYLSTLQTTVSIGHNVPAQVPRIAQLTQKTNQFNLTTRRYSETEIMAFMNESAGGVFTIDVSDKFGSSGLTGVAILSKVESPEVVEIDSYLLSCRILGRKIEVFFLDYVLSYCSERGYKKVRATYLATSKNAQVKDFYEKFQFKEVKTSDTRKEYELELSQYKKNEVSFIKSSNSKTQIEHGSK